MKTTVLSFSIAATLTGVVAAAPPSIGELAPNTTVILAGVKNASAACEHLKQTGLWSLWTSDEMSDHRASFAEHLEEFKDEMSSDLGLEADAIKMPSGSVGLAVFTVMNEEIGMAGPAMMLVADYGEGADDASEMFDAMIRKGEEEGDLKYVEREVAGRTVRCFDLPKPDMNDDFDDGGMGGMPGMADPGAIMEMASIDTIYFVREGSTFLVSTDMAALRGAFETFDGEPAAGLSVRGDYKAVAEQLEGLDSFGMLLTRHLGGLLSPVDPMGMATMMAPMAKQMIGDVKGIGSGYRLAGDHAMIEQNTFVYMPNGKAGLSSLATTETPRNDVPAFVGPNATNYSRVNFDFKGLPSIIRMVSQMIPMMQMQQGDGPAPDEMVREIAACLGDQVHVVQTLDRPVTMNSVGQFWAIECTNARNLENMLSTTGAQMGFEGRDFLGHRIYAMDPNAAAMMMPMGGMPGMAPDPTMSPAVGIGGGWMFAGPGRSVEQAMRTIGQSDVPQLAERSEFRRAVDVLGDEDVVGWGFFDLVDAFEGQLTASALQTEAFMREMAEEDPEMAAEFEDLDMGGGPLDFMKNVDWDLLRRHVGPAVWELHATDDGFVMKSYTLASDNEE